ncbi:Flp family type IVb pilin [Dongia deserti]|uniref:Flp family type IVb pilin n=1 Tax=Dongia deserti TaxID=2268030 RepID=UPI000E64AB29|nr:Flp family type IVb pilin [Dongia deserti]
MLRFFRKLRKDENGATAIEYGLIAGLISVVIIGAVTLVGNSLNLVFMKIEGALENVVSSN